MRRYCLEVKTLALCHHKFLVPILGFTATPPYCIATEFMPNGSLDVHLRRSRLSATQRQIIAIGIACGMMELHKCDVIHRDLKLANILLDMEYEPRICDFGIARFYAHDDIGMTRKIGTPKYMAPEMMRGRNYDHKVDVYSFSLILYELSERVAAFQGLTLRELIAEVYEKGFRPPLSAKTPEPLAELIQSCWSVDPNDRPTFEKIYEGLSTGRILIRGAGLKEISRFVARISGVEEHAKPKQRKRDPEQALVDSISDPNAADWSKQITRACRSIEPAQVVLVLQTIGKFFADSVQVQTLLLHEFLVLLNRGPEFPREFVTYRFPEDLASAEKFPDHWMALYACLLSSCPELLQGHHIEIIRCLLSLRSQPMLIHLSSYVAQTPVLDGSFAILEILSEHSKSIVNDSSVILLLSLLNHILKKKSSYVRGHRTSLYSIFVACLGSTDPAIVATAYSGIIRRKIEVTDFQIISQHLRHGLLWKQAVDFLSTTSLEAADESLIIGLSVRSTESHVALKVLSGFANDEESLGFIARHRQWLYAAEKWPVQTFRLILIVFQVHATVLVADRLFGFCLRLAVGTADMEVLAQIPGIITDSHFTTETLVLLIHSGFLREYNRKVCELQLIDDLVVVLKAISRIGYVRDFTDVLQALLSELNTGKVGSALAGILELARHTHCAELLRKLGFRDYLEQIRVYPELAELATRLNQLLRHHARRH
jgi:hypothetical protein